MGTATCLKDGGPSMICVRKGANFLVSVRHESRCFRRPSLFGEMHWSAMPHSVRLVWHRQCVYGICSRLEGRIDSEKLRFVSSTTGHLSARCGRLHMPLSKESMDRSRVLLSPANLPLKKAYRSSRSQQRPPGKSVTTTHGWTDACACLIHLIDRM